MRAALLITAKDLRQRLRDRSALLIAIVVPLVLASIFGLIFKNATGGRVTFTFGVLDEDHGAVARRFVSVLDGLHGLVVVKAEPSAAAGRSDADNNKVAATFVLPAGFSSSIQSGRPAGMQVLGSVDSPIGAQVAKAIADRYADGVDTVRILQTAARSAGIRAPLSELTAAAANPPVQIVTSSRKNRQLDTGTYYSAAMAVFFLFFTVEFGVASILEERRDGTLARMLVAPIGRRSVLGGKVVTSLALGILSMTVLALATHFLLSAHWGNALGVALLIVCGVLAATCVMALVVTLARTPDQAQSWQAMVALVLGMLGGSFFPVAQAGGVLAALSLLTPQAWFLRGIENMVGGDGPSAVLGPVAAMLAFALVTGALAAVRAGRLVPR